MILFIAFTNFSWVLWGVRYAFKSHVFPHSTGILHGSWGPNLGSGLGLEQGGLVTWSRTCLPPEHRETKKTWFSWFWRGETWTKLGKNMFFWGWCSFGHGLFFAGIDWKLNETRLEDFVVKLQDHLLSKVQNLWCGKLNDHNDRTPRQFPSFFQTWLKNPLHKWMFIAGQSNEQKYVGG